MAERKPPPAHKQSTASLETAAKYYHHFRKHIALEGPVTKQQVEALIALTGLKARRIRFLAAEFQKNPVPECFVQKKRGPTPGVHYIDPDVYEAIDYLVDVVGLKMVPLSRAEAAHHIWSLLHAENGEYRFPADKIPSERTITRLLEEIPSSVWAKRTMGSKTRTAHEPHPHEYLSDGFMDLVQMDHTRTDVVLVDSFRRQFLARAYVTFFIEITTRVILGYYVSFGDPSIFTCGRAVASAVLPKQPVLDHFGIELPYPMRGFFRRLHADQAKPHRAEAFRRACLRNGIDPDVRKPGPANHGGHIERLIGTMVGKMRVLPGATGSNTSARDGYDAEKDASMTLAEFEEWLVLQIIEYHHTPHTALDELCPQQVWNQAVLDHGPLLPISLDAEKLFLQFLPTMERTVQSRGIQIDFRFYWHPKLGNRIGQKVSVSFDRRTIRHVYLEIEGEEFITLDIIGRYPDVCWEDWEAERQRTRKAGKEFQAETGRAVTSRAITSGYHIIHNSRVRSRETRAQIKRQEREGMTVLDLHRKAPSPKEPKPKWLVPSDISNDNWLKDFS